MSCLFCNKIPNLLDLKNPYLVHEFKNSLLLVGEHQMFSGYSVLVLKDHVTELFDLPKQVQTAFNAELLTASQAISKAYSTDKINVASYGNMTPHLHWHIFPRHKTDVAWPKPPWVLMDQFKNHITTDETAALAKNRIQKHLGR